MTTLESNHGITARRVVDYMINLSTINLKSPARIILPTQMYMQFLKEIQGQYFDQYAGWISDPKSYFDNVLYRGIPICRDTPGDKNDGLGE